MQFAVLGAALAGFICVGKDFIQLWLGDDFGDVYYLSLLMMIPVTFTLIQNVCLSILRARNMMRFRTGCLIFTAAFNAAVTVVGTRLFNYYAAAIGTSLSVVVGSIILMNIYYHKKIGFKVFKFYFDVFKRLILCVLAPAVAVAVLSRFCPTSWLWLGFQVVVFLVIYALLLWFYGLTGQEKRYFWKGKRNG
jgi:O-antigen/teichoic acid export membrane protein